MTEHPHDHATTPDVDTTPAVPTVEIVDVTPEQAGIWLQRNPNNRNLRRQVVDAYARDMTTGSWALNGETVKLSASGDLLDGQHRLSAVLSAGQTVPMIVVRGVDSGVMPTVDAGAKRTYSDVLKLRGEDNTAVLAAVTRKALLWERGFKTKPGALTPTPLELNAFLEDHQGLRDSAEIAARLAGKALLPSSIIGVAHWLFSAIDSQAAGWFLSRLADGDGLSADDPIAALRNRIVKMRMGGGRVSETDALALVIYAWNAHRSGQTRTKLQLPRGGLNTENFPEPR